MLARRSLALVLLALASGVGAQDIRVTGNRVEVISPRPDSVSITIYRDLFALVTETRTIDLPAAPITLTFAGVVDTLMPHSVVVQGLDRPQAERNYDYEQLAPANLLRKSIGKTVTLTRTAPGSGKVTKLRAVILAANEDGVTLRTEQGNEALHCSGIPESLTFDEMPEGLHSEPTLSLRLAAGKPGKQTIRVSYLAQGFAWNSDYVARINERGSRMDLTGWLTLRNFTNSSFRDAQVQVVAGRLNLLYDEDGGSSTIGATEDYENEEALQYAREIRIGEIEEERDAAENELALLSGCYPFGGAVPRTERQVFQRSRVGGYGGYGGGYIGNEMLDEVIVTGMRRSVASLETLGDYQLYRLPWSTDLNARQTKQAVFLDKQDVKIERFYGFRFEEFDIDDDDPFVRPRLMVSFENRKASGLGDPLPAGNVRFFDAAADGDVFAGEARMGDKPVGLPVELAYAGAIDLTMRVDLDDDPEDAGTADVADVTIAVANAKPRPVSLEIRQALDEDTANAKIVKSNHRVTRKFGDYAWRFTVPANSAGDLTYRIRVPEID